MPIYGSSSIRKIVIERLVGYTGPTGPTGPIGNTGNTGNTGFGATGNTGPSISNVTKQDNIVVFTFNDGSERSSNPIIGPTGTFHLHAEGTSLDNSVANFIKFNQEEISVIAYDDNGYSADVLNFRNLTSGSPEITISDDGETITVTYDLVDVSALGLNGGPVGALVKNNVGDFQTGYTGTSYDADLRTVHQVNSDVYEKLTVNNATAILNNSAKAWLLDSNDGVVNFYLGNQLPSLDKESWIIIKSPENPLYSQSISVISPPMTTYQKPLRFFYTSSNAAVGSIPVSSLNPVVWPLGYSPCFSGRYDLFSFFSIGNVWYGYLNSYSQQEPAAGSPIKNNPNLYTCNNSLFTLLSSTISGITFGLCCDSECGYTLSTNISCPGHFISGVTYSEGLTYCDALGACCLFQNQSFVSCDELKYCECANIAEETNYSFYWNKFSGLKQTCEDFNCENAKINIGACCDGSGKCEEIEQENCSGYWQGAGVNCNNSKNLNVCFSGYGACCDSGVTCSNDTSGEECFENNKTYFGDSSTCDVITCSSASIPCLSIIPNTTLSIGDEYADGYVVGIFNPDGSRCFGSELFRTPYGCTASTTLGGVTSCVYYSSRYDFSGYGFTASGDLCDTSGDSYIMIISKHPLTINENGEAVDYTGSSSDTTDFVWSNGSNCWGPLFRVGTTKIEDPDFSDMGVFEGYLYNYSLPSSKDNLSIYSFASCNLIRSTNDPEEWITNKPNTSFNGKWSRNYGLLNTARLINSEFVHYYDIGATGLDSGSYTPVLSSENVTVARAISAFNEAFPETNDFISDWYLPSYDELSFIASRCSENDTNNLNTVILSNGGTMLEGWHWSSTGTFTDGTNEYVLNHPSGLTHGTSAWTINFDNNIINENFETGKKKRTENYYKIRPIKMIRCDGRYYSSTDNLNKYWRLLKIQRKMVN